MAKKKAASRSKRRVAEKKPGAYKGARRARATRRGSGQVESPDRGATAIIGRARGGPSWGRRVRKNMDMDQDKLDMAKRFLGARTETETVDAALDLVAFQGEVFAGIEIAVAAGGFADVYED